MEEEQAGEVYLKIIEDMGNLYLYSPVFQDWNNAFSSFDNHCECLYGKRNINEIRKEKAKESQPVETYIAYREEYKEEKNPVLRARLLQIFTNLSCAFLLDPEMVIHDTKSEHETLSNQAFEALHYIHHEKVREYAYTMLHDKKHREDVICMIANNYQKEDKEIFVDMVKIVPIVYHGDEYWHGVFFVLDMFKNRAIKNPPKELLLYMYENTQCSCCRESILIEMGRRRMITKSILMEYLWDSNEDIREYANRKMKNSKLAT